MVMALLMRERVRTDRTEGATAPVGRNYQVKPEPMR
jgi:hypothetical protein